MNKYISKKTGLMSIFLIAFIAAGGMAFAAKAHKHTFEKNWTTNETNHWHTATCEHSEEKGSVEAHKFGKWVSNKDATCCNDGTKTRTCKTCKFSETDVDKGTATGLHLFLKTWTGDASGHWHPAACGNPDAKKDFTTKHKFEKYVNDNNATCEEDETQSRLCSICNYKDTKTVPKTKKGHSFSSFKSNNDATCEADGTKSRTCSKCGKIETVTDLKSKKGHSFNSWTSNNDATCLEDGTKSRTCSTCGKVETVTYINSKKGHSYSEDWTSDETNHWHAATCEHTTEISEKVKHNYEIYKTNFNYGNTKYTSNNDATCTKDGTKSTKCQTCGYVLTVEDERSAKGHKSDAGTITKAATTKTEGEKIYKCSVCGETIKTEVVPKLYAFHETVEKVDTVTINGTVYDIVTFGDYPQSVKAKDVTVDESQKLEMGRFTYYLGSDSCYYVKAKSSSYYSSDYTYYEVEPIRWRVVTKNYNGTKKALLVAENVIDAMTYYGDTDDNGKWLNGYPRTAKGKKIEKTNYVHSQVRAFLNGLSFGYGQNEFGSETFNKKWENKGFLQSAFTTAAQGKIAVTTVDNSSASAGTLYHNKSALCENTKDKIFLLSVKEVSTVEYGFPKADRNGSSRIRNLTSFAESNFGRWNNMNYYWWLRTPRDDEWIYVVGQGDYDANWNGGIGNIGTSWTNVGIVPALTISY